MSLLPNDGYTICRACGGYILTTWAISGRSVEVHVLPESITFEPHGGAAMSWVGGQYNCEDRP